MDVQFRIYEDEGGEWRWRLVVPNGRIIADSGEGYVDEHNAKESIDRLRKAIAVATVVFG